MAHVVGHPVFGDAVAARARRVGVVHHRPVGLAVRHHQQRALRGATDHFLRGHLQRAHAGGAGLLHGGAGHAVDAHQAGHVGQAIEAALLRVGHAQQAQVDLRHVETARGQCLFAHRCGQRQGVHVGQRALPFGKGRGPVDTVGNEGLHSACLL